MHLHVKMGAFPGAFAGFSHPNTHCPPSQRTSLSRQELEKMVETCVKAVTEIKTPILAMLHYFHTEVGCVCRDMRVLYVCICNLWGLVCYCSMFPIPQPSQGKDLSINDMRETLAEAKKEFDETTDKLESMEMAITAAEAKVRAEEEKAKEAEKRALEAEKRVEQAKEELAKVKNEMDAAKAEASKVRACICLFGFGSWRV